MKRAGVEKNHASDKDTFAKVAWELEGELNEKRKRNRGNGDSEHEDDRPTNGVRRKSERREQKSLKRARREGRELQRVK